MICRRLSSSVCVCSGLLIKLSHDLFSSNSGAVQLLSSLSILYDIGGPFIFQLTYMMNPIILKAFTCLATGFNCNEFFSLHNRCQVFRRHLVAVVDERISSFLLISPVGQLYSSCMTQEQPTHLPQSPIQIRQVMKT